MGKNIQDQFNAISKNYDKQRKKLIPCFDDFYGTSTALVEATTDSPSILDIGAGTGLFSSFILNKFPKANLTLIDISDKMLDIAKLRFKDFTNINYIAADYTNYGFEEKYDIIISALSIHHLSHDEKIKLFKNCYAILKPNGIFINADQVHGDTPFTEALNKKMWRESIENSGLSNEELLSCYERIKLDQEATLHQQLSWLSEAGFTYVDCAYKHFHFAVMYGKKD